MTSLKERLKPPRERIVPENPQYYDMETAFSEKDEIARWIDNR